MGLSCRQKMASFGAWRLFNALVGFWGLRAWFFIGVLTMGVQGEPAIAAPSPADVSPCPTLLGGQLSHTGIMGCCEPPRLSLIPSQQRGGISAEPSPVLSH